MGVTSYMHIEEGVWVEPKGVSWNKFLAVEMRPLTSKFIDQEEKCCGGF